MRFERIMVSALLILGLAAVAWSVGNLVIRDTRSIGLVPQAQYGKIPTVDQPEKCKAPAGYTEQEWQEHMSHHPDQYRECLGGVAP